MFCTIQLLKSDPTPLYIQLAQELAQLIKTGALPAQTKLPTIRSLSKKLNINRDTVVSAYKLLENQGLIIAYVGSGTYVGSMHTSDNLLPLSPIACSSIGFPKNLFPTSILQEIMEQIITTEGWDAFSDPLHRAKNHLRQAISTYFQSIGIEAGASQLRLTSNMFDFLIDLLKSHPSHYICVESYHDLTYISFLRSLGIKLIEIPLTPSGMDLEVLESALKSHQISFIWLSSYIQNPTGACYSEDCKAKLLELAHTYNCYLIEDTTYIDFTYSHSYFKPLFTMDYNERVILLHHFSKLYLPHLQYSFIALPNHLSKRLSDSDEYGLNERVLDYYLSSSSFSELRLSLIERSRYFYYLVHEKLLKLSTHLQVFTSEGGLFFFIKPLTQSIAELTNLFVAYNIVVAPSELFCNKSQSEYLRISISHLDATQCTALLDCLESLGKK